MNIGKRLGFARKQSGLTLRIVGKRSSIGLSSLSEFEHDKREPTISQLKKIAAIYRLPVTFFIDEAPLPIDLILWRLEPSPILASRIKNKFFDLCREYHKLQVQLKDQRSTELPLEEGSAESFGYKQVLELSKKIHHDLRLGDYPAKSLLSTLEGVYGVKAFHLPFEPSGSAACTLSHSFGPAILLNSKNVRWRRNFDLAHELFHLLTWPIFRSSQQADLHRASEMEEKFANAFASRLLLPEKAIKKAMDRIIRHNGFRISELFFIAHLFDVSVEALVYRLVSLHYISRQTSVQLIEKCKKWAPLWEMARKLDTPKTRPRRYRILAIRALQSGQVSLAHFAQIMGISRREASGFSKLHSQQDELVQLLTL
jgi:Zn-dependent peptidase ImmA (M78 family)/transcriptional regulator with XRE-family HTH domain